MKPRFAHINHVTILVSNKSAAEKFYTETLGLEAMHVGKSLWLRVGEQFIHVTESSEDAPRNFSHFCISVENCYEYLRGLAAKGIEVFDLDTNMGKVSINSEWDKPYRQFFIHDPDGNLIEFCDATNEFFHQKKVE